MGSRFENNLLPVSAATVCGLLLAWWLVGSTGGTQTRRDPGDDNVPAELQRPPGELPIVQAGEPVPGPGKPASLSTRWEGFRGARGDGIAHDSPPLARSWPAEGPPMLWTVELGEGYASPAVAGGCAYVLDYDEGAAADTLRCLSLDDGREVWRNSYPVAVSRNHGMSRTVPVIVGDRVITFGPRCHVACWKLDSGECEWLIDLVRDHGAIEPRWYAGQCPLVDQGRLILAPCGDSLLIAVDIETGEVIWECPNTRGWEMTHVSVVTYDHGGRRSYLYCGSGGIAAVAADDGSLLWDSTDWQTTFATCPSPLVLPDGRIFLCNGYGRTIGSMMLAVDVAGQKFVPKTEFTLTPKQFNSEHHTPILYEDHIYGVRKTAGGQMVCLDLQGAEQWNSGSVRFGHGPYLIADGLLFAMDDHGVLTLMEAVPSEYRQLAQAEVIPQGHDAWGPMALVDGRLILRDMTRMTCIDVSERPSDVK